MNTKTKTVSYSAADHITWAKYYARQKKLAAKYACKEFLIGSKKLALDPKHIPDMKTVSARLKKTSGWTLKNCGNRSVSMEDWFLSMRKRSFPVTNYIRIPEHFDYTAKPDLLHEYFGHLPFFTNKKFAEMAQKFGEMCKHANKRQLVEISRIWSLGVEFGAIKENGKIKLIGAGLLSSYGECLYAMKMIKKGKIAPFELKAVTKTPGRTYEWHKKYFVMNGVKDISDMLTAYNKKESLL